LIPTNRRVSSPGIMTFDGIQLTINALKTTYQQLDATSDVCMPLTFLATILLGFLFVIELFFEKK